MPPAFPRQGARSARSERFKQDAAVTIRVERDYPHALNLGTDRLVTIDELVDLVSAAAGKKLIKRHDLTKPQGVRGRNSDNTRLREVLNWEPSITLEQGLAITYRWIESELRRAGRIPVPQLSHVAAD